MEKYLYIQGFCQETHYTSLQPVLYEKEGEGEYRRVRMACNGSCASCGRMESCDYLESAPERIRPEKEWQLRDTLMTGTKER